MLPFKKIVVATDLHDTSEPAVDAAVELAKAFGAELTLVHVFEGTAYPVAELTVWDATHGEAERQLDALLKDVRKKVPGATAVLRDGWAWQEVLAAAEEAHADVLVMGTHGRRGLAHAFLGSVAERIVQRSPVPVLVVRTQGAPAYATAPADEGAAAERDGVVLTPG